MRNLFLTLLAVILLAIPALGQDWGSITVKEVAKIAKKESRAFWTMPRGDGTTPLMVAACNSQDEKVIREMLRVGSLVNQRDLYTSSPRPANEWTALLYAACYNENTGITRELIHGRAEINYEDISGQTALMVACRNNTRAVIEEILKGDPNLKNALDILTSNPKLSDSDIKILKTKLSNVQPSPEVEVSAAPLIAQEAEVVVDWEVFQTGTPAQVEAEIDKLPGATGLETKSDDGSTPLMDAALYNTNPEVVSVLIKAGAEMEASDENGMTPLMLAAGKNTNPGILSVLIKAGAKIDARSKIGTTPLMRAAANPNSRAIEILLERGAKTGMRDKNGRNSLFYAARYNSSGEVISKILDAGGKINVRYRKYRDRNALMIAAQFNPNPAVISVLIDSGGSLTNKKTEYPGYENSALVLAAQYNPSAKVLALIIEAWNTGNQSSEAIANGLMDSAVYNPSPEVVSFLFESGACAPSFSKIRVAVLNNPSAVVLSLLINRMEKNESFTGDMNKLLMIAAEDGRNPETLALITDFGADVNCRDESGSSPLHSLLFGRRSLRMYGRVLEKYENGLNSIDEEKLSDVRSCLSTLVDAGADVDALLGESRMTPLMLLMKFDSSKSSFLPMIKDCVGILIDAGANLRTISSEGKTVLDYAKENDHLYETQFYWELNDAFHNP